MINIVFSSHRITDAQVCPRLYYYKHELLKGPLKPFEFYEEGELLHYIFRLYYLAKLNGFKDPDPTIYYELGRNFAAKRLSLSTEKIEEAVSACDMYFKFYVPGTETWQIDAVEKPFAKILYQNNDLRIVVTGQADLLVTTMRGKGPQIIVDHKYESQFRKKGDRDNQALCYAWAFDLNEFLYNRIGKQKSYKPEKRLLRDPHLHFGKHQIEEWKDSAIYTALELVKFHTTGVWPARYTGCMFQGRKCTFYSVCNTTPSNREFKLNTFYKDVVPYDAKLMEAAK